MIAGADVSDGGEKGDRKGPRPSSPLPRLYNDNASGSPGPFIVEAGVDVGKGGDPCGRLSSLTSALASNNSQTLIYSPPPIDIATATGGS
jgi:hypothetical protein